MIAVHLCINDNCVLLECDMKFYNAIFMLAVAGVELTAVSQVMN